MGVIVAERAARSPQGRVAAEHHERLGEDHRQATRLEALRVAAGLTSGQEESADPAVAEPGPGGL